MGRKIGNYLERSDSLVKNSTTELDKILESKSSTYLSGLGDPILVTWYNMNDYESTADNGLETSDAILGKDSPFRFNKVVGLPVFGLGKAAQDIELAQDDNGIMDYNLEIECVIPPNTIIPGHFDHMEYRFGNGRIVIFRVNNITTATMKTNGMYKVGMHMVDIDTEDYHVGLEELVVKTMRVKLDNVGTNEKCIISDTIFDKLDIINELIERGLSDYIDTFYVQKYNAFVLRNYMGKYIVYDPYLTKFMVMNGLVDYYDSIIQPVIISTGYDFKVEYNQSIYRAFELKDAKKIQELVVDLTMFPKKGTNPFDYWGEEVVYLINLVKEDEIPYPKNIYMDQLTFIGRIAKIEENNNLTILENSIIRYFKQEFTGDFLSDKELEELKIQLNPSSCLDNYYFYIAPLVLFVLSKYKEYLNTTCS
jgi:hypothetical protein